LTGLAAKEICQIACEVDDGRAALKEHLVPVLSRTFLAFLAMVFLIGAFAPGTSYAHPSEDELIRQLEEQYGRPRPSQDPDRQHQSDEQAEEVMAAPTLGQTIGQYIVIGYQHILPKGLDHILLCADCFSPVSDFAPY